jgi:hypothetical protein
MKKMQNAISTQTEPAAPSPRQEEPAVESSRKRWMRRLSKLGPIVPYLTGGLRMVDHGAAQILANLLTLAAGPGSSSSDGHSEIRQELEEIEASHRDLLLSVQGHGLELKRFEEQILLLRQSVERNALQQTELAEELRSLRTLILRTTASLAVLFVLVVAGAIFFIAKR